MAAGAPQAFLPPLPHFSPGGAGQPSECGRRGEAPGWETDRGSVPFSPLPRKYGVLHYYTAPDILTTYITLFLLFFVLLTVARGLFII